MGAEHFLEGQLKMRKVSIHCNLKGGESVGGLGLRLFQ